MASRFYVGDEITVITPDPDADWEVGTISATRRRRLHLAPAGDGDLASYANATNDDEQDQILWQFIFPLAPGQTVTGSQAIKAQFCLGTNDADNNVFFAVGIRVIASDSSTVQKTVLAVTRDDVEVAVVTESEFVNRQFTATSAAGDYTTVAGDCLVCELGVGGAPAAFFQVYGWLAKVDELANPDLPEDDTESDYANFNSWLELADTLLGSDDTEGVSAALSQAHQPPPPMLRTPPQRGLVWHDFLPPIDPILPPDGEPEEPVEPPFGILKPSPKPYKLPPAAKAWPAFVPLVEEPQLEADVPGFPPFPRPVRRELSRPWLQTQPDFLELIIPGEPCTNPGSATLTRTGTGSVVMQARETAAGTAEGPKSAIITRLGPGSAVLRRKPC